MHLKKITIFPWLSFAFLLLFEYLLGAKFHRKLRWPMSTERGTPSRKWDPRAWWWRGNWRGRSRIKSSTASSFRDFEQAGFFSRIVSPAIIFFFYSIYKGLKNNSAFGKKRQTNLLRTGVAENFQFRPVHSHESQVETGEEGGEA